MAELTYECLTCFELCVQVTLHITAEHYN